MKSNFRGMRLSRSHLLNLRFERNFIREEAHPEYAHTQTAEHSPEASCATCFAGLEREENNHCQPGQCEYTGPTELGHFHARTVELMIEEDNQQTKKDRHQQQVESHSCAKINHQFWVNIEEAQNPENGQDDASQYLTYCNGIHNKMPLSRNTRNFPASNRTTTREQPSRWPGFISLY